MALSDQLATELRDIWAEKGRSRLYFASSLEDENPKKDEIRKAYIYGLQRKAVPIGILSPWREKLIDRRDEKIRRASTNPISDFQDPADASKELIERRSAAEKLHKYLVNLKNSRNGWSSHEANVKESSFENFLVPSRMDREKKVSDPADASKELIERRASKGKVVIPSSSLGATHVSEIWFDWEIPSLCESNLPTELEDIWAGKRRSRLYCASSQETRRRTHPGKHGHNVGSNAFRNWAQGGDGSGVERTIQDDWGSADTTVNRSVQMTSPPAKTTLPTLQTPPSPTRRATPQAQPPAIPTPQVQQRAPTPQVQTPGPPPPPPPPPRPPGAVGWFNFNVAGLAEIFLGISLTIVLAPPQILHSGGNSLSANDRKLLFGAQLFGFAGFILCSLAYIVQGNRAAKLLIAFGLVANIFGLLLIVALGR